MREKNTLEKCLSCGNSFQKIMSYWPSKVDDKRNSFYECPYCNHAYSITLDKNEDVSTQKIEFINYYISIPKSNNFNTIVDFYLLRTPAKRTSFKTGQDGKKIYQYSKVSHRGKTFRDIGIIGNDLIKFRKKMQTTSYDKKLTFEFVETFIDFSEKDGEFSVILKNSNMSQTDSIFYCIRNALAHGSFSVENQWYKFENENKGKLKGKMKLHETTLLKWIELFNDFDNTEKSC